MGYKSDELLNGNYLNIYLFEPSSAITAVTDLTSVNTEVIAFGTGAGLQVNSETITANSKFACRWQTVKNGHNSYTVNTDSLYTNATGHVSFDTLLEKMTGTDNVGWALAEPIDESSIACEQRTFAIDPSKVVAWGEGIITSLSISANTDEFVSCSTTITGDGEIRTA